MIDQQRLFNPHNLKLAVIIPAYRCEKQIGSVLRTIPHYIDLIVVVDDASPDNLKYEVEKITDNRLVYLRHEVNQGVGQAMMTGYNHALAWGADIFIKMDGDGQMNPTHIPLLLKPILNKKADYTKGNRFLHRHDLGKMPKIRFIGNLGLTFLTKLASGYWQLFDPNNGFTAIHKDALLLVNQDYIHKRYFFESSLLIELNHIRAVAVDVAIPAHYGDEQSSLSVFRSLFEFPVNLLRGLLRRIIWQYFLYDFTSVSLFLIMGTILTCFGTLWGLYHWYISIHFGLIATTGTVMVAMLPFMLGVQLLLQALVLDIQNVPTYPLQQTNSFEDNL